MRDTGDYDNVSGSQKCSYVFAWFCDSKIKLEVIAVDRNLQWLVVHRVER